jgi:hypothetical protein
MPEWFKALLCFLFLAGFIGFAFRQGFQVKPTPRSGDDDSPQVNAGMHH